MESKAAAGVVNGLLKGTKVSAKTVFQITNSVLVNFRWGLRVPRHEAVAVAEEKVDSVMVGKMGDQTTGIRLPFHQFNSYKSCVSKYGSNIFSKREVIKKLRQQLKKIDDMILEMQDKIIELHKSISS